jgi:hypothetical protein
MQQPAEGHHAEWESYNIVLYSLLRLPTEQWQSQHWGSLAAVLGGLVELSRLYAAPMPTNSKICSGTVFALATLSRKVLGGEWTPASGSNPSASGADCPLAKLCRQQLLDCTAHFLTAALDVDVSSSNVVSQDALILAQQITSAGLCSALATTVGQAARVILSVEQKQQQQQQQQQVAQDTIHFMHTGTTMLRLALAVATMWPGGILKSGTARRLAGAMQSCTCCHIPGFSVTIHWLHCMHAQHIYMFSVHVLKGLLRHLVSIQPCARPAAWRSLHVKQANFCCDCCHCSSAACTPRRTCSAWM